MKARAHFHKNEGPTAETWQAHLLWVDGRRETLGSTGFFRPGSTPKSFGGLSAEAEELLAQAAEEKKAWRPLTTPILLADDRAWSRVQVVLPCGLGIELPPAEAAWRIAGGEVSPGEETE